MTRIVLHTDGGARGNPGPAGYGAVLTDAATGERLATRSGFLGRATNNVAEYTAVVEGLRAAALIDPDAWVEVRADSKLVVEQMSGRWKIKHEDMRRLALQAREVFPAAQVTYRWIPRAQNAAADALANAAMDSRKDRSTDEWRDAEGAPTSGPAIPGGTRATPEPGPVEDVPFSGGVGQEPPATLFDVTEPPPEDEPAADEAAAAQTAGQPGSQTVGDANRIYLVRHGVTDWTVTGRQSGSDTPGPDLTRLGRGQAAAAGRLLTLLAPGDDADLTGADFRVSPMVRTRQTAQEIARAAGLGEPRVDDRLREVTFGEWDGLTVDEIHAGWPGRWEAWRTDVDVEAPGGESHRQLGARVAQVLRDVMGTEGRSAVLVAHAVVIRVAVAMVGRLEQAAWGRVRVRPGSVTMLSVPGVDDHGRFEGQIHYVGAPCESTAEATGR